jgi:hypothetical protein
VKSPLNCKDLIEAAVNVKTRPAGGSALKPVLDSVAVYSGTLEAGTYVYNSGKGKKERVGRLLEMHANERIDIKIARAGDIVAIAGLKDTFTGETLCDEDHAIVLERMVSRPRPCALPQPETPGLEPKPGLHRRGRCKRGSRHCAGANGGERPGPCSWPQPETLA